MNQIVITNPKKSHYGTERMHIKISFSWSGHVSWSYADMPTKWALKKQPSRFVNPTSRGLTKGVGSVSDFLSSSRFSIRVAILVSRSSSLEFPRVRSLPNISVQSQKLGFATIVGKTRSLFSHFDGDEQAPKSHDEISNSGKSDVCVSVSGVPVYIASPITCETRFIIYCKRLWLHIFHKFTEENGHLTWSDGEQMYEQLDEGEHSRISKLSESVLPSREKRRRN